MNTSSTICLSIVLSIGFASFADAAKENFDRSKPQVSAAENLDNNCNGKNTRVCKAKQVIITKPKLNLSATRAMAHNASRSNTTSNARTAAHNSTRSNKTSSLRATDYNSSRSNKQGIKQDGNDLILRKRPGRNQSTLPDNCLGQKKDEKRQVASNCPTRGKN